MSLEEAFIKGEEAMNYEAFNTFCGDMHATSYVMQWGRSHVWKVGGKVFAIGGWFEADKPAYTFKASALNFDILKDEAGFRPAPYMASRGMKWIQQYDFSGDKANQLKYYIEDSYRLVSLGLSKKKQKELGLNR